MSEDNGKKLPSLYSRTLLISHAQLDTGVLRDSMKPADFLAPNNSSSFEEGWKVRLMLHGLSEYLILHEGHHIKLGRFEPDEREFDELDLAPYRASSYGVSRVHAQIFLKSKQLFITDLQSTNGTYLRGMKVTPYVPAALSKGDEVRLGRLALQVMFSSED
jgi:hypothetical protein